ncbi:MAG TPA: DUF4347 domain-containing protein [Pirellulaceae bacterium]|nr:DUF4347 domain-containing protein [Pirellulaceae bacterium]
MGIRTLINRSRGTVNNALRRIRLFASARPLPLRAELDLAQLEDRIMLSASPIGDVLMPVDAAPDAAEELAAIASPPSTVDHAAPTKRTQSNWNVETQVELVFVDQGVQDYERLVADLLRDADPVRQFEIVMLDENRNGIEQISDVLLGYTDLSAVHLVSHGSAGRVNLGNLWLSDVNVDGYAGQIAEWNSSLSEGADLLIYGCDLASTEAGRTLVESLGALCDCDVASSDDETGHAGLGGDWDLEHTLGEIETEIAFSDQVQENWFSVLASATFQDGVAGYTDTADTELDSGSPGTDNGTNTEIELDNTPQRVSLIQFDNIFGLGAGQIPLGSTINTATLATEVSGAGNAAANVELYRMLTGWTESDTWNSMVAGISLDDVEASSTVAGTLDDPGTTGSHVFSGLAAGLQTWSDGTTNDGWAIFNDHDDPWKFYASDEGTIAFRPLLTVDYR